MNTVYLNVLDKNGEKYLTGLYNSEDQQQRYGEMSVDENTLFVGKLKLDINNSGEIRATYDEVKKDLKFKDMKFWCGPSKAVHDAVVKNLQMAGYTIAGLDLAPTSGTNYVIVTESGRIFSSRYSDTFYADWSDSWDRYEEVDISWMFPLN